MDVKPLMDVKPPDHAVYKIYYHKIYYLMFLVNLQYSIHTVSKLHPKYIVLLVQTKMSHH